MPSLPRSPGTSSRFSYSVWSVMFSSLGQCYSLLLNDICHEAVSCITRSIVTVHVVICNAPCQALFRPTWTFSTQIESRDSKLLLLLSAPFLFDLGLRLYVLWMSLCLLYSVCGRMSLLILWSLVDKGCPIIQSCSWCMNDPLLSAATPVVILVIMSQFSAWSVC